MRVVVLFASVLAVTACGAQAKPKTPQRAAIPDLRGLNLPDATVRLIDAHYCVRLERGTPPAGDTRRKPGKPTTAARMPVQRQSPPAGSTRRAWSTVTLTVGGIPARAVTSIDLWAAGTKIPCPRINTIR
jgi:beta-lactam-binding protein with PASTA domain